MQLKLDAKGRMIVSGLVIIGFMLLFFVWQFTKNTTGDVLRFDGNTHSFTVEITTLKDQCDHREAATAAFKDWLDEHTNYTGTANTIERFEELSERYEIELSISLTIDGRTEGYIGFKDYILTKDGKLFGVAYSK